MVSGYSKRLDLIVCLLYIRSSVGDGALCVLWLGYSMRSGEGLWKSLLKDWRRE